MSTDVRGCRYRFPGLRVRVFGVTGTDFRAGLRVRLSELRVMRFYGCACGFPGTYFRLRVRISYGYGYGFPVITRTNFRRYRGGVPWLRERIYGSYAYFFRGWDGFLGARVLVSEVTRTDLLIYMRGFSGLRVLIVVLPSLLEQKMQF